MHDVPHPTAPADYKFIGWSETANGAVIASSADLEVSIKNLDGLVYYAQFEKVTDNYTVVFKYTNGKEINKVEKTLPASEDYVLTSADVYDVDYFEYPSDYEFLGWTDTVDGTDYKTSAELQVSIKDLDGLVYYAQFKKIEVPVTYKVEFRYTNDTVINTVEKDLLSAEDYVLTSADVCDVDYFENPADYEFLGWTETVDGTDYKTSAELQVSIRDLNGKTYYARFRHIDDVKYNVEHYFEQPDGSYVLENTETLYAKPGTDVTATALATLPDGYVGEKLDHAERVAEGTVPELPEVLTLKLYYYLDTITVTYNDCGYVAYTINNGTEMRYEVKYGGTIDNFYDPADDTKTNDEIKAEIDNYIEYLTILGYGKDYDGEYMYNRFVAKDTDGNGVADTYDYSYPIDYYGFKYEHEIGYKWYVEDDDEEYVLFHEGRVFTEDLDIHAKIKKLNIEISFPEKLTTENLTIFVPYEESTRFLDSIRDALFLGNNIATFPSMTGIESDFYDKLVGVAMRFFEGGFLNEEHEINKTNVMVYFYQMMGGKAKYQEWLWEEVEESLRTTLRETENGARVEDDYMKLRESGLNQEQALKKFFVDNHYGLDMEVEYAVAYNKYLDSKEFIEMSSNEDYFYVTENNDFIMEMVKEKISSLATVDSVVSEYGGGRVPEGLINRIPSEFTDIYDSRVDRFLAQLKEARDNAALGKPKDDCKVDSGILFDVNLIEEILIPGMDNAKDLHDKAVKKAVNSGNKAAELIEKYYVDNPYVVGDDDKGIFGVVNYGFDYSKYIEDIDGDKLYTIKCFEDIYYDVVMPMSVESVDALLWYMDPEGGSVDITKLTNLARDNEALILALHNHPNALMAKYAEEGLPKDMVTYWNDLLSDPEIAAAVEKLDNKTDAYKDFDMAFFVETKLQNATIEMYYLKVLDKLGVPVEAILSKYTNSKAYKELTHDDFEKLLCQLEECWATVEVEIDGEIVAVENAIGTTDYVFDNVLEKVGKSGNKAKASFKGFEMIITRFYADTWEDPAPTN